MTLKWRLRSICAFGLILASFRPDTSAWGTQIEVPNMGSLPEISWESIQGKPFFVWNGIVYDFSESLARSETDDAFKSHREIFQYRLENELQLLTERDIRLHQRADGENALVNYLNQFGKAIGILVE